MMTDRHCSSSFRSTNSKTKNTKTQDNQKMLICMHIGGGTRMQIQMVPTTDWITRRYDECAWIEVSKQKLICINSEVIGPFGWRTLAFLRTYWSLLSFIEQTTCRRKGASQYYCKVALSKIA